MLNLSLFSFSSQNHSTMNITCVVEFLLDGHPEAVTVWIAVLLLSVQGGWPVLGAHHTDVVEGLRQHHHHRHLEWRGYCDTEISDRDLRVVVIIKAIMNTFSCQTIAQKSTRVVSMVPWVTM